MGNQGQNMFTISISPIELLLFEKSVRMIYFLVIKQVNMSKNFKIGGYVYAEKKYTCVMQEAYCNFKIENQRGKMGLNASDVSRINPTLS